MMDQVNDAYRGCRGGGPPGSAYQFAKAMVKRFKRKRKVPFDQYKI